MLSQTFWIVLAGAAATYLTRVGGHLVLSRFRRVHPRVEAALDAVPAAVLTTLVAPVLLSSGPAEIIALLVAGFLGWRSSMTPMFVAGAITVILFRNIL